VRVLGDLAGHRTHHQPGESASAARAKDEHVGVLAVRGAPAPAPSTLGTQDPPDKGRPGAPPGTLVLNLAWAYCLELT